MTSIHNFITNIFLSELHFTSPGSVQNVDKFLQQLDVDKGDKTVWSAHA